MAVWSIPKFSKLPDLRYDPEYYQPSNLELSIRLATANPVPVSSFADVTDGIHASPDWVESGGTTYLSAKCVKDNCFVLDDAGQISQEQNMANPRTQARINDVLITTVGTIGNAAVVYDDILPANMDRHLGIIRIRDTKKIDPYYLATFLNCKYGRFQSLRDATGNVQLNLFIAKINKLLVPVGDVFNEVGKLTRKAYKKILESQSLYPEAEAEMLDRMSWKELTQQSALSHYIQRFSGTQLADRVDPEHFKPKCSNLRIQLEKVGAMQIGQFSPKSSRGVQPEFVEGGEIFVLDSKSIRPQGVTPAEEDRTSLDFYLSDKAEKGRVQFGDVLLNSTGLGTLGRASCYQLDKPALVDNHVSIIRPDQNICLPVYLSLFLNSPAGLMQTEMYQTGSSGQLELYPIHIQKILVFLPRNSKGEIDLKWQEKLAKKVIDASRAKVEAQVMLEKAKRMVEDAIEQEFVKIHEN